VLQVRVLPGLPVLIQVTNTMGAPRRGVLFFGLTMIDRIRAFFWESYQELKKVAWPGRKEIVGSTIVVVVVVVIFMTVIWLVDWMITKGLGYFLKG
jgi:preprotein translocase subunit SecE